jgi:hypothetical protein
MKLTNKQILSLSEAIGALDGRNATHIMDGKVVVIQHVPKLTHAGRWALARNAGKLQLAADDFNRAKSGLIKQHANGAGQLSPADPGFNAFAEDFEKLTLQEAQMDLDQIALGDLRLEENEADGNAIPIAVLNALSPLIAA